MNEKWMNYFIILTVTMLFVNGFIFMAAAQPDQNNNQIGLLYGSTSSDLTYEALQSDYVYVIDDEGYSSQSPTNEQGYTPIKNEGGLPAGLDIISLGTIGVLGLELVLLQLANIFGPVAPLFYAMIGAAIIIKSVVVMYLASVLVRALFGRQI